MDLGFRGMYRAILKIVGSLWLQIRLRHLIFRVPTRDRNFGNYPCIYTYIHMCISKDEIRDIYIPICKSRLYQASPADAIFLRAVASG